MMNNIEWIFFDIGSTLVDESRAYEHRIKDTIKNSSVSYAQFCNLMIDFAKQGILHINHFANVGKMIEKL